ncbi:MAG: hypothetical protein R3E39_09275 [Anaerolineae bacterium]
MCQYSFVESSNFKTMKRERGRQGNADGAAARQSTVVRSALERGGCGWGQSTEADF